MDSKRTKPFWEWKADQMAKDKKANGGVLVVHSKDWYHAQYGLYVDRKRKADALSF